MGLGNNSNGQKIFLGIKEGKIILKHKDSGRVEEFDNLEGTLRSMWIKHDGQYGPELQVTLRDAGQDYCLQMRLASGYARSFMKIAPNFALAEPMKLVPSVRTGSKENLEYGMFVYQGNKALKWYYTRDTPNGLPELMPCKVKNNQGALIDGWDGSAQLNFLVSAIIEQNKLLAPDSVVHSKENAE